MDEHLLTLKQTLKKGAGFIVLIDPDKNDEKIIELAEHAN